MIFFNSIWIRDFDISVSLDLGVKGIGGGQRTIERFNKIPPDHLGQVDFSDAQMFFAHII